FAEEQGFAFVLDRQADGPRIIVQGKHQFRADGPQDTPREKNEIPTRRARIGRKVRLSVDRVPLIDERTLKTLLDCGDLPGRRALFDELDGFAAPEAAVL